MGQCDHEHPHEHSHGHGHHHHGTLAGSRLVWAISLTMVFVIGESLAGWIGHSVALLSDAGHNLADALALLFSWYALCAARRPSTATRTFGYHRVGIFAALVNAASLVAIALLIVFEGAQRLIHPSPYIHAGLMIGVAAVAVLVNLIIAGSLHRHADNDLNVRSAYLHMIGDAASACAVIVAGIIVAVTGNPAADPIVSFIIAALIMWSSWGILKESVNVLLEATPAGLDMGAVADVIAKVEGVLDVHDLHVWTVGPGVVACSCHIVVAEQTISSGQQVLRAVVGDLQNRFAINHTTVQVEVEGCEPNHIYCNIHRNEDAHVGHHH